MLSRHRTPDYLAVTGYHLEVKPTLKSVPVVERLIHPTVSPAACDDNSLGLLSSFRASFRTTQDFRPHLLEVATSSRFFCGVGYHVHIAMDMISLMEFLPYDAYFFLEPVEYRGYRFP